MTGVYEVDPVHTFVLFRVRHLVVGRIDGRFTSFRGQFEVVEDAERLFDQFEVTFDAASVDTQFEMRDEDLRGTRFFDASASRRSGSQAGKATTPAAIAGPSTAS